MRSAWLMASILCCSFLKETVAQSVCGGGAHAASGSRSVRVDRDALDVVARLLALRQGHGQDTVAESGLRLVLLHAIERDLALERAVIALAEELSLVAALGLLLAAD